MNRCTKCILPENTPKIEFDARGICNFCTSHTPITYLGQTELEKELKRHLPVRGKYDVLVPLSGGKDSTYVLLQLHAMLGKRVLAYNYDNGLVHPQAQDNVRGLTERLGVDLIVRRNEQQRERMIANLKAYLRKPDPAMVTMLCTSCRYGIMGNAYKIAREHKIPLVVIGWSPVEDTPFKEELLKGSGRSVMTGLMRRLVKNPAYASPVNLAAAAKDYFHNYSHVKSGHPLLRMLYPNVSLLQYYEYIPYNPDQIQREVTARAGWRTPDGEDSWQFDCKIKLLQNYLYSSALEYTATDSYLSAMIRENFIDRDEALRRLTYLQSKDLPKTEQLHAFLRECALDDLVKYFPARTRDKNEAPVPMPEKQPGKEMAVKTK